MNEAKEFYAKDRHAWHRWLGRNHETSNSVWLVFDKVPARTLTWDDIVREALCFGWIDSTAGSVSAKQSKIYVCKRKPKSGWSSRNKRHVEQLQTEGLMTPAGQAVIDAAKQSGAWDALNKSDALELPSELVDAFTAEPDAAAYFKAFPNSSKKVILEWIYSAKKDETRLKRIRETLEEARQNIRAHHA